MAEEKVKPEEKVEEKKEEKKEEKAGALKEEEKKEEKAEKKTDTREKKTDVKDKKGKKKVEKKIEVKDKAVVYGKGLRISTKSSVAVCKMISRKSLDRAMELLAGVVQGRIPVRMTSSEVAHQKSRGMKNIAGAKFPKKVAEEIGELIKQLNANSIVNGIENPVIVVARADKAKRPFRRGGRKAKRTHVYLEARNKNKKIKK